MTSDRQRTGRLWPRLGFVTILLLLASNAAVGAAATPRADPDGASSGVAITLDSLDPAVPTAKSALTLHGTLTNNTDHAISGMSVTVSRSAQPLTDSSAIGQIAKGEDVPDQTSLPDGSLESSGQLGAHASRSWTYKHAMGDFGLIADSVYSFQVTVSGSDDSSIRATTNTFVPWFPDKSTVRPTNVAWLYPLVDWPGRDADDVLLSDRTPVELSPGGRLRNILDAGLSGPGQLIWVIDPELTETATHMTKGYSVLQPNGTAAAVPNSPTASAFLTLASAGLKATPVVALQYADPDVNALTRAKLSEDIVRSTTAAPELLAHAMGRPVTGGFSWPPGGRPDRPALDVLQNAGIRTILMNEDAMTNNSRSGAGQNGSTLVRTQTSQMTALLADQGLTDALSGPQASNADATMARQQFLCTLGVMTSQSPRQARTVIAAPTIRWQPSPSVISGLLAALRTAPWARSIPLARATQPASAAGRVTRFPGLKQRRLELPPDYLQSIRGGEDRLDVLASIMDNPTDVTARFSAAFQRAESGAWRLDMDSGQLLLQRVSTELSTEISQVRVLTGGTVSFASSSGKVPVTIANDLDRPVHVGIKLSATPAVRLVAAPIEPMTIPANHKISTEIPAQVLGDGGLEADVQLTAPTGHAYGLPSRVHLRSTAYAGAAAWVVGIAFLALTAMIATNAIRRHRHRRAAGMGSADE